MIITNTSFYAITCQYILYIHRTSLHLEGPVTFIKVKANRILYNHSGTISYHNYIEFSNNTMTFPDHTTCIIVQENTTINMTNNEYSKLQKVNPYYYEAHLISNFTAPCYYQYTAEGQNFDMMLTEKLNFSIVLHNDTFIHNLMTAHCRWLPGSAFNTTKPLDINKRLIESDLPLIYDKMICKCSCNHSLDCYTNILATVYPGQTISLSVALNFRYTLINLDITNDAAIVTAEINEDVLPPTACKVAKVSELNQRVYTSCTPMGVINLTIVHNGISYSKWYKIFIRTILINQIDAYYIDMLPCPAGFVQENGICICDPILTLALQITEYDINHQTIL